MSDINKLRETLNELQDKPELVLQVLLEQGWVTDAGTIAPDLNEYLDDAADLAFEESFDSENDLDF